MIFSSYEFLFLFLPVVLLGYYVVFARRGRTVFLTVMSYAFYGWWDYRFCGLLLISSVIDYAVGRRIVSASNKPLAKRWLILSMTSNLAMLGFFKYFDLGAETVNWLASQLGADDPLVPMLHLVLPVGISFYTFQTMSYSIDLYHGRAKVAQDWWSFACYVALFPQLVAGPIVRYHELAEQMVYRTHTLDKMSRGAALFIIGLAKKILLADGVAPLTSLAFGNTSPGFVDAWTGVLAYTMQIYFDFSGYSDMAVGLGLMFGFRFPVNFNSPYKAESITDFWRRWHISLSSWLRDYLYIPLGGSRIGASRTYVNLFLVMLLGGLWHGASWTFMIWGGYHGILLAWERMRRDHITVVGSWSRIRTFLLVCFGWVVFRAASVEQAADIWAGLFGLGGWGSLNHWSGSLPLSVVLSLLVVITGISWWAPNSWVLIRPIEEEAPPLFGSTITTALFRILILAGIFLLTVAVMLINTSSPFLYFQF